MTSHRIHQRLSVEELEQRVAPATLYVSPTGDNANSGTFDSPWATPGYASRQLSPGDTLVVLGGRYVLDTYDEDIIIPPSGTAGAWVTIRGETGNRPVLAGGDNLAMAMDLSGADYVRVENLEITHDSQATGAGTYFRDGIVIAGEPTSHIVLDDLYIHHIDEFGLDFQDINDLTVTDSVISYCGFGAIGGPSASQGGWQNVRIENTTLSYSGHYYQGGDGSSRPYDRPDGFGIEPSAGPILIVNTTSEHNYGDGLDSKAANTTIRDCIVANNSCDGVKLWNGTSRIENTLIYGRGDGDSTQTPWAAIVIGCTNANAKFEIMNTTVHDTSGNNYILYAQYDETTTPIDLTIRNSIFSGVGPVFLRDVVTLTAENNLFYMPSSSTVLIHGNTEYTSSTIGNLGTGNQYGDPLFVSPAWGQTGDYHLKAGSPAINAGMATGAPAADLDGNARDATPDIGAYESVTVSSGDPMTGWSGKIILGNHVGGQTVDGELDYQGLLAEDQALQQITGRHIAFVNLEIMWNWNYWPSQALDDLVTYDAVPMFNFKPWAEWDVTDPAFSLDAIIAGQQDAYLDQVAAFAVNYNHPIIITFACEMNGDWFPWSGVNNGGGTLTGYGDPTKPDGPERYVDAYRHVVDRFRADGADNVIWVFQPDAYPAPETSWNRADAYYPGDNYVDWLGVSVYGKQTKGDDDYPFRQGLDSAYTLFTNLAPGKPVMVAEWGRAELSPSGSKAQWITSALTDLAANRWPNVRAICYWDEAWTNDDNSLSDLRINSSTASRNAYRSGITNTQRFVDTWHPSVGGSANTPPTAVNDSATVSQNSTNNVINVLSNDTDADNDTLTVTSVGSASHGTAQLASGQVRYTPTAGYSGSDSFSYTISDGNGGTASAVVNVTVAGTGRSDGAQLLYAPSSPESAQNAVFSPDGGTVLFTIFHQGYNDGPAGLYTVSTTGGTPTALLNEAGQDSVSVPGSSWNAKTGRVAFTSDRQDTDEIWTMASDGSGLFRVTTHTTNTYFLEPSFSPDGQWIVFEEDTNAPEAQQQGSIWKVKADGTGLARLTNGPANGTDDRLPNWSPL
ncbi:MAG: hypothetical protein GXP25_05020, partial [Planctomycetes bacterium]|nr:hypothetical protein [Planctomycetota bacterium]